MNRLQALSTPEDYCVKSECQRSVAADKTLRRMVYFHPVFTLRRCGATAVGEISGQRHTHFCGAYCSMDFMRTACSPLCAWPEHSESMLMLPEPAIYTGTLRHRRFQPKSHEFTYRLFMALLDIDRIPETMLLHPSAAMTDSLGQLRGARSLWRSREDFA